MASALYMIIQMDPKYKNPYKKLEVLEQQYEYGTEDVLFYLEAYLCYKEKPILLRKLGESELLVLTFAVKIPSYDEGTGPLCSEFCQPAEGI